MGTIWTKRNVSVISSIFFFIKEHTCNLIVGDDIDTIVTTAMLYLQPRWATSTGRLTYPAFVAAFNQLTADRVWWNPYTAAMTAARAPRGLSIFCYRDQQHWFMKKALVFDIFVEPYCVHRMMHQLGVRQEFPLPREQIDKSSHL